MLPRAVGAVASKPGLASLLEGALSDGCVKIAASAAAAAIAAPSIAHIVAPVVLADAALASSSFSFRRPSLLAEVKRTMHGQATMQSIPCGTMDLSLGMLLVTNIACITGGCSLTLVSSRVYCQCSTHGQSCKCWPRSE